MSDKSVKDLAGIFNPVIRGWINYYGRFYGSALHPILNQLNASLQRCKIYSPATIEGLKNYVIDIIENIAKFTWQTLTDEAECGSLQQLFISTI